MAEQSAGAQTLIEKLGVGNDAELIELGLKNRS
jgi:hypothetical protein